MQNQQHAPRTTTSTQPKPVREAGQLFSEKRQQMIELIAEHMGGKPANAVGINPDEELSLWLHPTASPEQLLALRQKQAGEAAALPSTASPGERADMAKHQDEEIMHLGYKYRYELGQANGKADPEIEAAYHEKMLKKAVEAGHLTADHIPVGHPLHDELAPAGPPAEKADAQGWTWEGGPSA